MFKSFECADDNQVYWFVTSQLKVRWYRRLMIVWRPTGRFSDMLGWNILNIHISFLNLLSEITINPKGKGVSVPSVPVPWQRPAGWTSSRWNEWKHYGAGDLFTKHQINCFITKWCRILLSQQTAARSRLQLQHYGYISIPTAINSHLVLNKPTNKHSQGTPLLMNICWLRRFDAAH